MCVSKYICRCSLFMRACPWNCDEVTWICMSSQHGHLCVNRYIYCCSLFTCAYVLFHLSLFLCVCIYVYVCDCVCICLCIRTSSFSFSSSSSSSLSSPSQQSSHSQDWLLLRHQQLMVTWLMSYTSHEWVISFSRVNHKWPIHLTTATNGDMTHIIYESRMSHVILIRDSHITHASHNRRWAHPGTSPRNVTPPHPDFCVIIAVRWAVDPA